MPEIRWIGKKEVLGAVRGAVRLLRGVCGLSAGDDEAGNLLVQGDNLEALRTLLPHYGGRVKCVYIDPPYNTGNEEWEYNDRVDSPKIRRWLGKTVGDEASDLCRHDKWLCMILPRLRLLQKFLREDGVIFVSIDDNEVHRLRMLMDEIFGEGNFVALLPVVNNMKGNNDQFGFSGTHEYILVFCKNKEQATFNEFIVDDEEIEKWVEDDLGFYKKGATLQATGQNAPRAKRPNLYFPIFVTPEDEVYVSEDDEPMSKKDSCLLPMVDGEEMSWRWQKSKIQDEPHEIIVVRKGSKISLFKKQRPNGDLPSRRPKSLFYKPGYSSGNGTTLLKEIFNKKIFNNPKPLLLIKDLIYLATQKDSIVLDSFAGSGTTAHAVLALNKEDGGDRKFILVEMEEDIARNIAAERLKKIIKGYKSKGKSKDKIVAPLGGGFRFCTLGPPLLDDNGHINKEVRFADLAAHVFFYETGMPIPKRATTPLLGVCEGRAIYLLYNGIMGDKSKNGGNVLTPSVLRRLPAPADKTARRIIFGEACLLSKEQLAKSNILFRQIPYQIRTR